MDFGQDTEERCSEGAHGICWPSRETIEVSERGGRRGCADRAYTARRCRGCLHGEVGGGNEHRATLARPRPPPALVLSLIFVTGYMRYRLPLDPFLILLVAGAFAAGHRHTWRSAGDGMAVRDETLGSHV